MVPKGGRRKYVDLVFNGHSVSFRQDEMFWRGMVVMVAQGNTRERHGERVKKVGLHFSPDTTTYHLYVLGQVRHLISLYLSFLICKICIVIVNISWGYLEDFIIENNMKK